MTVFPPKFDSRMLENRQNYIISEVFIEIIAFSYNNYMQKCNSSRFSSLKRVSEKQFSHKKG